MCCLLLLCAVLKTLHSVKHILNEDECRSVGKAEGVWWDDDLAVVIAMKPPSAVQVALGVLEKYKGDGWYDGAANGIMSKLCSTCRLCRHTFPHTSLPYFIFTTVPVPPTFSSDSVPTHIVDLWY